MEIWMPLSGYENYYKISNLGNIFSFHKNRLLKPHKSKNGYSYVTLVNGNTKKYYSLHRIVAKHFVPGYSNEKCFVNHINENKTDNRAVNLEWCTKAYNNTYNGKTQRCCKAINQFSKNGSLIKTWESARKIERALHISYKNISACSRGLRKSAGGYVWNFV